MTTRRLFALTIFTAGLLTAAKPPLNDGEISTKVQLKLGEDTTVKGGGLKVDVTDGMVTLGGKVESQKQKAKAESLAKKVPGVKSVVNNIVVTHAP
jgi:hyperosmotically inducible protein